MSPSNDVDRRRDARVGSSAGFASPDPDAQVHKLAPRLANIARAKGLGRIVQNGSWRYSLAEISEAEAESARRKQARVRKPQGHRHRGIDIFPPRDVPAGDTLSQDPLDRVEQILFRAALRITEIGAELHQAAQIMKAGRLEWEAELVRRARREARGS